MARTIREDALLSGLIRAAVAQIDGRDGWLGRQLITATWRLALPAFPCGVLVVPLPPLQEITRIEYIDVTGDEQTLDASAYHVAGSDPGDDRARIWAKLARDPPPARRGHGSSSSPAMATGTRVPEDIRHGLQLLVVAAYDGCTCEAARNLLFKYRAW